MSVSIYRKDHFLGEIDVQWDNSTYFDEHTLIPDNTEAREILRDIEHAEYVSSSTFRSLIFPEQGEISKKFLSSGTKTALNIIAHPDVCFSAEVDDSIFAKLLHLKQGHVYRAARFYYDNVKDKCDVLINGQYWCGNIDMVFKKFKEMPYELEDWDWF